MYLISNVAYYLEDQRRLSMIIDNYKKGNFNESSGGGGKNDGPRKLERKRMRINIFYIK